MTQQELAKEIGISRQTIIAIEANNYNPSITLALSIARYFDAPIERLFWLEEDDEA